MSDGTPLSPSALFIYPCETQFLCLCLAPILSVPRSFPSPLRLPSLSFSFPLSLSLSPLVCHDLSSIAWDIGEWKSVLTRPCGSRRMRATISAELFVFMVDIWGAPPLWRWLGVQILFKGNRVCESSSLPLSRFAHTHKIKNSALAHSCTVWINKWIGNRGDQAGEGSH